MSRENRDKRARGVREVGAFGPAGRAGGDTYSLRSAL